MNGQTTHSVAVMCMGWCFVKVGRYLGRYSR